MIKRRPQPGAHPRLIDLHEAGTMLGVHPRTIRRKVATGELAGFKLGPRCMRVELADVLALIESTRVPSARFVA